MVSASTGEASVGSAISHHAQPKPSLLPACKERGMLQYSIFAAICCIGLQEAPSPSSTAPCVWGRAGAAMEIGTCVVNA